MTTMSNDTFETLLARDAPITIDGGLATQCEAMGCDIDGNLWSAALLQKDPQAIVDAHRTFLDAGAEIIITASYQANRAGFMARGLSPSEADELIVRSVALAIQARQQYLQDISATQYVPLVAASVGPYGAALNDGSEYTGQYNVSRAALREFHEDRLRLLDDSDADLLACETIPSIDEAQVLCELLQESKNPAWVSFSCRDETCISDGTPIAEAAALFHRHPHVLAVGINCTAPQFAVPLILAIKDAVPDKSVVVYPNSGETYHVEDNSWSGTVTAVDWARAARTWHAAGAVLIGGCCRMGAQHVQAIADELRS